MSEVVTIHGPQTRRTSAESVEVLQPFMGMEPEEFQKLSSSILVAIPHRPSEGVQSSLVRNMGAWALLGTPFATISDQFSGFIELTRNGMVRTFLKYCDENPNVEYLCMIDNDESVDYQAPYRLAQWGKDIVTGIVCNFSKSKGGDQGIFACITVKDSTGIARFPTLSRTKKLPAAGLREIHTAGTGLMCVHKRVFQKMIEAEDYPFSIPEDVRKECVRTGTLKLGEDMAFCERAHRHGFKVYVDFSVRAKHYKTVELSWPDKCVDPNLSADEWQVADDDYVHE